MKNTIFQIDHLAILLLALFAIFCFLVWRWSKTFQSPRLLFSSIKSFDIPKLSWRENFANLPLHLLVGTLLTFTIAFTNPTLLIKKTKKIEKGAPLPRTNIPTEGIAIYLVLDQSGSMADKIKGSLTKEELLKKITREFIIGDPKTGLQGRPSDMIGLVTFARGAQVLSPLTLDHEEILKQLVKLDVVKTQDQDGTSIGYAIFKTANLIAATRHYAEDLIGANRPAYDIKSAVIILVTDGFQSPSPLDEGKRLRNMDIPEAAEYAAKENVKLYIVNIEPRLGTPEFAPYRNLMQKAAEITGGKFYYVSQSSDLSKIYADIDKQEKSALPPDMGNIISPEQQLQFYDRISFYPYLVGLGMLLLILAVVLYGTVFRRAP